MTCTGPDCAKTARAKNLCAGHYAQSVRGLPLTPLRPYSRGAEANPHRLVRLPAPSVRRSTADAIGRLAQAHRTTTVRALASILEAAVDAGFVPD